MADIELVIKIPEAEYELIVNDEACGLNTLTRAIAKGTQLPKEYSIMLKCPKCGLDVHSDFESCPRCGAKMKVGE